MAESNSSAYSTANESEKSETSTSEDDLIEHSSIVQAHSNKPLARMSDENSDDDDEDSMPSDIIAQRYDGIVSVDLWYVF